MFRSTAYERGVKRPGRLYRAVLGNDKPETIGRRLNLPHRDPEVGQGGAQTLSFAHELGRLSGKPAVNDLLLRRRRTPSQGGLGALARHRNVAGAFAVDPRRRPLLQDKRVLLIDDVLTTGATVSACAGVLLRSGARAVDVLTLARVVRIAG